MMIERISTGTFYLVPLKIISNLIGNILITAHATSPLYLPVTALSMQELVNVS